MKPKYTKRDLQKRFINMKKTYWRTFNVLGTQVGIATELKTTLSVAIEATEQVSIRNSQLY